jgi:inorganic pyrophosphatase
VIECRTVGMFVMRDEKGPDEKVLCVPAHDPRYTAVQGIDDIPVFDRMEITDFFEVYKDLEPGTSVEGSHWGTRPGLCGDRRVPPARRREPRRARSRVMPEQ